MKKKWARNADNTYTSPDGRFVVTRASTQYWYAVESATGKRLGPFFSVNAAQKAVSQFATEEVSQAC